MVVEVKRCGNDNDDDDCHIDDVVYVGVTIFEFDNRIKNTTGNFKKIKKINIIKTYRKQSACSTY